MADHKAPKKSLPLKSILMVVAVLVVEAVLIIGAMLVLGGEPEVATAGPGLDPLLAEEEKIIEVLVLDAKLPNAKSGVAYLYSAEIYVQVRNKNADRVGNVVDQFYNEIKAEISAIWRTSDPHHFQEPKLENLTRKVHAMLSDRFGVDVETGDPVIEKTILVMGTGFRVDR